MKIFYFLDGSEKKGPFTEKEFKDLNLKPETLIWVEGFDNWVLIKDYYNSQKTTPQPTLEQIKPFAIEKIKSEKTRYSFYALLILVIISFSTVHLIIHSKKTKSKNELSKRIENLFNGKSIVCDGQKNAVDGDLNTIRSPIIDKNNDVIYSYSKELNKYINTKGEILEENIIEKFTCYEGGFNFIKIKKVDSGYEVEVISSSDMEFTSSNHHRGTVQEAYNYAYNYLIEENSECFLKGYYDLFDNFKYLQNDYYQIANTEKPSYPNATCWWNESTSYLFDNYRKVYYETEYCYYEITEKNCQITKDYIVYSSISIGVSLLLSLLLLISNPFKW